MLPHHCTVSSNVLAPPDLFVNQQQRTNWISSSSSSSTMLIFFSISAWKHVFHLSRLDSFMLSQAFGLQQHVRARASFIIHPRFGKFDMKHFLKVIAVEVVSHPSIWSALFAYHQSIKPFGLQRYLNPIQQFHPRLGCLYSSKVSHRSTNLNWLQRA